MVSLQEVFEAYYDCRRNKRSTEETIKFELNFESNCIGLWNDINDRQYRPSKSIAFIVTKPKRREIFAASFRDRVLHHFIDIKLRPLIEKDLIEKTCNNRKGKGTSACVNYLREDIRDVSENYTKSCWVSKLDMKGFFMSIRKDILTMKILEYVDVRYMGDDKEDLKWLLGIVINDHPEKNCILKSPWSEWEKLNRNKSLFWIGDVFGIPIGNLISQLLANFYLNDFDHYVTCNLGFKHYGRYVDDFYLVDTDKSKMLNSIPFMRAKLTEIGVTLHPDKFYMQHYTKGIEFVGSVLKTKRIYVHNRTINNAYEAINKLNNVKRKEDSIERFVAVINSYLGFMKNKDTYAIRRRLINKVSCDWFRYVFIEGRFEKVVIKREFREKVIIKNRLNNERKSRISERKGRGYFRVKSYSL